MFGITEGRKYLVLILIITYLLSLSACGVNIPISYGSIYINSTPPEAKVYLDGVDTGQITPTLLPFVLAGTHTVKLDRHLYKWKVESIVVMAEETTDLNWDLDLATIHGLYLQPGCEGKDAYVDEGAPGTNYGDVSYFYVGYYLDYNLLSYMEYRAYLYFDVSSLSVPLDAVVTSASLIIHQYDALGIENLSISLYPVTSEWEEDTITWNNQPTTSSEAESSDIVDINIIYALKGWFIRDLVRGWLDGSITNHGVVLKSVNDPSTSVVWLHSSDHSYTNNCPKLEIYYYIP